jgi:hypothetical protein
MGVCCGAPREVGTLAEESVMIDGSGSLTWGDARRHVGRGADATAVPMPVPVPRRERRTLEATTMRAL